MKDSYDTPDTNEQVKSLEQELNNIAPTGGKLFSKINRIGPGEYKKPVDMSAFVRQNIENWYMRIELLKEYCRENSTYTLETYLGFIEQAKGILKRHSKLTEAIKDCEAEILKIQKNLEYVDNYVAQLKKGELLNDRSPENLIAAINKQLKHFNEDSWIYKEFERYKDLIIKHQNKTPKKKVKKKKIK